MTAPAGPSRVRALLTADPLVPARLLEGLGGEGDGAVALFAGRVRDRNDGRRVQALLYEAYEAMAERELARIAEEALEEGGVGEVVVAHRTGRLRPGEVSVVVAVAAPHRADAFRACRRVMEAIKHRLPVWKREEYADGSRRWIGWEEGATSTPAGAAGRREGGPGGWA